MRLTTLALFLTISLYSCREDDITGTQKSVKDINEHLSTYQRTLIDLSAQNIDAGSITMYVKDKKLVLAVSASQSESSRGNAKYYFDGDDLMCVVEDKYTYNKPTYMTEEQALKDGDSVWYDDTKTRLTTNRYYFYNGNMVKWIDTAGKEVSDKNKQYMLQAVLMLRDAEKLKKMNDMQQLKGM